MGQGIPVRYNRLPHSLTGPFSIPHKSIHLPKALLILLGFCLLLMEPASAQRFPFSSYGAEQGLFPQYIYSMDQDQQGRLLLGTEDGLWVYDGRIFERSARDSVLTDHIVAAIESSNDDLLAATFDGMLVRRSGYDYQLLSHLLPLHATVKQIVQTDDQTYVLLTQAGDVFCYNGAGEMLALPKDDGISVNHLTYHHGQLLAASQQGIVQWEWTDDQKFESKPWTYDQMPNCQWIGINPDGGQYWLLDADGQLLIGKPGADWTTLQMDDTDFNTGSGSGIKDAAWEGQDILWLALGNEGLARVVREEGANRIASFTRLSTANGLKNNNIQSVFFDREGQLWVGTYGEGLQVLPPGRVIWQSMEGKSIQVIEPALDGSAFLGGEGLYALSSWHQPVRSISFDGGTVSALSYHPGGGLWIGTEAGELYRLSVASGDTTIQLVNGANRMRLINDLVIEENQLFICSEEGLWVMDLTTEEFSHYTTNEGLVHNVLRQVVFDEEGKAWFAAHGAAPFSYENGTYTVHKDLSELASYQLNDVMVRSGDEMWFATNGQGIFGLSADSVYQSVNQENGMLSNYVYSLINGEASGEMLALHQRGYSRIQSDLSSVQQYHFPPSLPRCSPSAGAMAQSGDGALLLGLEEGFLAITGQPDLQRYTAPTVTLHGTYVDGVLKDDSIALPYGNYDLRFQFAGVSLRAPEQVTYRYRLSGRDREWRSGKEVEQGIYYSSLSDGDYVFEVEACLNGECAQLTDRVVVRIEAPFWKSLWFIVGLPLLLLLAIRAYYQVRVRRLKEQRGKLEKVVRERTVELQEERDQLQEAKGELEVKNKDITDSINYASRIQNAILPDFTEGGSLYENAFVVFYPRDIVSGDFYWMYQRDGLSYYIIADCTGHGVPGAFMSMIGSTLLTKIIVDNGITNAVEIIEALDRNVVKALKQHEGSYRADGMDLGLLVVKESDRTFQYVAASRPLFRVNQGALEILAGGYDSIGGPQDTKKEFVFHEGALIPGEMLYICSDGYVDQFGGPENRKYMVKRLKEKLKTVYQLPLEEQKQSLATEFEEWKGDEEQTDDVLMFGYLVPEDSNDKNG